MVGVLLSFQKVNLQESWDDNIRVDIKEISVNTRNWTDSAKDGDNWKVFVNAGLNLWVT
jgi:hypothetical protein